MDHPSCMNCSQQQLWNNHTMEQQWPTKDMNGSNASLNMPPSYYHPQQPFDFGGPLWSNGTLRRQDEYPYPFGMMPMYPGNPSKLSRFCVCCRLTAFEFHLLGSRSRVPSRAASPSPSQKSRRSTISTRNFLPYRNNYMHEPSSEEESTESLDSYMNNARDNRNLNERHEDSVGRSLRSSRQSHGVDDDDSDLNRHRHRHNNRERRASSTARSISSKPERRSQRLKTESTQDSEAESGTRALVQAKIREKVAQASSMDESSSDLWRPKKNGHSKTSVKENGKGKAEKSTTKEASAGKATDNVCRIAKNAAPKVSTEVQTTPPRETSAENGPIQQNGQISAITDHNGKTEGIADVSDIGPAPSAPTYEWECEFCTFTNEANTKICSICCKTPTTVAIRKAPTEDAEMPPIDGRVDEQAEISKEGKPIKSIRKISFWPGTKSK